jgi:hypothetical protein
VTYDEIVGGLRDSYREIENEGRLVWAGLKAEQNTAEIVERYAWLYSDKALKTATTAEKEAPDARAREAARRVRNAVMVGVIDRRKAPIDDRLTTFYAGSNVELPDGEKMPFFTAQSLLGREPDPGRRERIGEAAGRVMVAADEIGLELTSVTLEQIKEFGYASYSSFWSELKGVDYKRLQAELERVAEANRDAYLAWISPRMEAVGSRFGECSRWHLSYFRGIPEHDAHFSANRFESAMRRTFSGLGLDLFSLPTVHIDLEDRPAKNPRASVWVPEAGAEVHLLTRPSGGNTDFASFLHEAGHALHFGLTDPDVGWPLANLGRSMAYAELWSYLIEHIGHEPEWLQQTLGVDSSTAARISADLAGVELMMFVRYCGKLGYELELFAGDPLDAARGGSLYSSHLSRRTGFRYGPEAWQFDRDPGFYSADYLRAWLAQSTFQQRLAEMFGQRWWADAKAGLWLREQWRKGSIPEAEETVADIGGKPWSGEALTEVFRERLQGAAPT